MEEAAEQLVEQAAAQAELQLVKRVVLSLGLAKEQILDLAVVVVEEAGREEKDAEEEEEAQDWSVLARHHPRLRPDPVVLRGSSSIVLLLGQPCLLIPGRLGCHLRIGPRCRP